jgi:tetratricopeptide (TPR) repeat protein
MLTRIALIATVLAFAAPVPLAMAEETNASVSDEQSAPPKSRAAQLDELFATLKSAKTKEVADVAESSIMRLWLQSGSDTVDLLMSWAMKAMSEKDYPLALDFLDRVVTMKPDYSEGWNTRATVYYLTDDYSRSLEDINHTLALEPRHFGALSGLGMILRGLGEDKKAIDVFQRVLLIDPYLDNVKKALDELQTKAAGQET